MVVATDDYDAAVMNSTREIDEADAEAAASARSSRRNSIEEVLGEKERSDPGSR
jgi:hypothetical protein